MKSLTPLHDVESLDAAIAESRERPVLLFKHSRHCGTSFEALDELHAHIEGAEAGSAAYKMITVQTHRRVSDAVAHRFDFRQALMAQDQPVFAHRRPRPGGIEDFAISAANPKLQR